MRSLNLAVKAQNISLTRGHHTVINNLTFKIPKHSITRVIGSNGIGKSTTLKLMAKLISPSNGQLHVNENIGYAPDLLPDNIKMTVSMFLQSIQDLHKTRHNTYDWFEYSEMFNITQYKDLKLQNLSKGTLQKVNIIQSLLKNASILILDEPFSGLDKSSEIQLIKHLQQLSTNKTIIYTSHEAEVIPNFATHILNLDDNTYKSVHSVPSLKTITVPYMSNINELKILNQINTSNINISNDLLTIQVPKSQANKILKALINQEIEILEVKE